MPSVFLDFTPPDRDDLEKLHIFEATSVNGPWALIETVDEIGSYPDYISNYTTELATNSINWFSIQWEDDKGAKTDQSNAIQGGTETLVGDIVSRVHVRDASLDEQVVLQETEAILERYFNTNPYTVPADSIGYATKNSLAKIIHAKSMFTTVLVSTGSANSWTAGLVSMKSSTDTKSNLDIIKYLMQEAARELGLGISIVAQMARLEIAGGFSEIVSADISRLLIEVE